MLAAREREEVGERQARLEQPHAGRDDLRVARRVALDAVALLRHEQPRLHDGLEQRAGDAGRGGELVEREQVVSRLVGDRGGERRVRRVELAVEQAADQCERQPSVLEVADPGQPFLVLGPVPGDAPLPPGRREQPALLVEADRVDRDARRPGQIGDPEIGDGARGPGASTPEGSADVLAATSRS